MQQQQDQFDPFSFCEVEIYSIEALERMAHILVSGILTDENGNFFTYREIAMYCHLSKTVIKSKSDASDFLAKFGRNNRLSGHKFYYGYYPEMRNRKARLREGNNERRVIAKVLENYFSVIKIFKLIPDKPINKGVFEEKEAAQKRLNNAKKV